MADTREWSQWALSALGSTSNVGSTVPLGRNRTTVALSAPSEPPRRKCPSGSNATPPADEKPSPRNPAALAKGAVERPVRVESHELGELGSRAEIRAGGE